jgi:hypothetical protein
VDPEGILTTLAEVGIALAGFSGIVAVLGGRAGDTWSEVDRLRLSLLVHTSFAAVIWSFAPLLLTAADLSTAIVWQVTSGAYVAYLLVVLAYRSRQMRAAVRAGWVETEPAYAVLLVCGALAAMVLQLVNALSLRTLWPHAVAILWALFVGFMQFLRLLRSTWSK